MKKLRKEETGEICVHILPSQLVGRDLWITEWAARLPLPGAPGRPRLSRHHAASVTRPDAAV